MTISLDKTTLTTITRPNFTFSQETITASTDTSEGDEDFEEINSVTAVINQTEDNVTITGGDTSVAIVGTYANPFSDTFTYVDGDSSDKLMTPITVISEDNVPEDKIFFSLFPMRSSGHPPGGSEDTRDRFYIERQIVFRCFHHLFHLI